MKDELLVLRANEVSKAYNEEDLERTLHVSAIQHKQDAQQAKNGVSENDKQKDTSGNFLPHVSDKVTRLLNFWLSSSCCNQGFQSSSSQSSPSSGSTAFLSQRIQDWKIHLTNLEVDTFDISKPHQLKMVQANLEKAQVDIQKLQNQIVKLQTFYRQAKLTYFLESKNISCFTNKVCFQSKQTPKAHTSICDESLQDFRTCRDELEELNATSALG